MKTETLSAFVDGELSSAVELDVRRHLDTCEGCHSDVETLIALKEAVAATIDVRPMPHTLRKRLGTLPRRRPRLRWLILACGMGAAAAVALAIVRFAEEPRDSGPDSITTTLTADHIHYAQEPDALQVASRDDRDIAAWFSARVSFPVKPPKLQSATLIGARLCSLWGREAALTFYATDQERLSLFIMDAGAMPSGDIEPGECRSGLGGYEVCLISEAPRGVAIVGKRHQTRTVLPELRRLVAGRSG